MTRSSLANLAVVSRHPSISKGVQATKLHLEPLYDRVLAHSIRDFAAYRVSELHLAIDHWGGFVVW